MTSSQGQGIVKSVSPGELYIVVGVSGSGMLYQVVVSLSFLEMPSFTHSPTGSGQLYLQASALTSVLSKI